MINLSDAIHIQFDTTAQTMAITVSIPATLDDQRSIAFANSLPTFDGESEVVIDFRPLEWVYPFGTFIAAHAIKSFSTRRRKLGYTTHVIGHAISHGAVSYLKFFGFFRYIGVNVGLDVNEAPGGRRYLPITVLNKSALLQQDGDGVLQDKLDFECGRLARVIFPRKDEEPAADMLSYCFRELMRNSFEHARVSACAAMAQRWDNGIAEVVIADHGIGIHRSLNEQYPSASVQDSIRLALRPGISSAAHKGTGSEWDNTGFGLYVVSQLGAKYGSFSLLSSEYMFTDVASASPLCPVAIGGTIVRLKITTSDAEYWPNILSNIVSTGEKEAQSIPGAVAAASGGSKKSKSWAGY